MFPTTAYGSRCHFVHLMQSLENLGFGNIPYPIPPGLIASGELARFLAYDVTYLKSVHAEREQTVVVAKVRVKYLSTWQMIGTRHRALLDTLERNNFDPRSVADLDWSEAMRSVGTADGFTARACCDASVQSAPAKTRYLYHANPSWKAWTIVSSKIGCSCFTSIIPPTALPPLGG